MLRVIKIILLSALVVFVLLAVISRYLPPGKSRAPVDNHPSSGATISR